MAKFVHLIADYGKDDPAFSEVVHSLKSEDLEIEVQSMSMPMFSTIATGFWVNQIANNSPKIEETAIFANTAPRKHEEEPQMDNNGEELLYAEVEGGMPVLAVNSGFSLSFVKEDIKELRRVDVPSNGSQFRSRDYFPEAVAKVINKDKSILGEEVPLKNIPGRPENRVAFVDGYGNLKTSIKKSEIDIEPGHELEIEIDGVSRKVIYEEGTFEVPEGEISFAPGSSGGKNPFMEIFFRGGSAAQKFQQPETNSEINIRK